ncbi:hypothetical protein ACH4YO_13520 [Streptomyces noursei]|uniref:Cold shock protein (Beta-ribbon, CspA family) n=1 Tax=Streptomyces yunnanensis TaxID=156453 RepID=A0A9X8QYL2_9ACTN|nr:MULTISPECIES: hypothetical protein [Streptomyces]ANZ20367.1 hypothetical protein SNOUR_35695 [Streptomyces noursei ATCC 11455]MCZ1013766.1 hypothetical protein [Streptomyces noursei]QRX90698.1 hypothetical protein JNO44_07525 [Streptomyces noursei]UJB40620.1 hypothetical protein HRD51_07085 [Streptomyces sp. A1-5]SHN09562.1 cold shock protein (beta-ribbon, CspA family) [Streptomyces yunnanensis]
MPQGTIVLFNKSDCVGIIADEHGERLPFSGMETQTTDVGQQVVFDVHGAKATNVMALR